jgi:hypothetical protein
MANVTVTFSDSVGLTLYAFPTTLSLADWTTYRAAATEASAPNTGRYSVTLNDTYLEYYVFSGASQPASFAVRQGYILSTTDLDTEVKRIPRADSVLTAGEAAQRTLDGVFTDFISEKIRKTP